MNNMMKKETNSYDAIVIGSGVSGGWAAKELSEKGLKTLILERGRELKHGDYPTATMDSWDFPHRGQLTQEEWAKRPVQKAFGMFVNETNQHHFARDIDHPYMQKKPLYWIRSFHEGGRSVTWGRQVYRWSDLDFEANAKEGVGVDWPIRYKDIAPWYDYVEKYIGINGKKEGLAHLPDGNFLPPMDLNCAEEHLKEAIESNFDQRMLTIGRTTNLTQAHNGRGKCQFRNRCVRGCPYGAYFSSNSVTLPAAYGSGNATIRPNSIVESILYDNETGKASGVRVIDQNTKEEIEYTAKIIFCNASTLGSTQILLNSTSDRFPNGLGNDSDQLGRNLMDHHYKNGASGVLPDFGKDQYYSGRRPNGFYIPRFRNINDSTKTDKYLRGYGYQGRGARIQGDGSAIGEELKSNLLKPGPWNIAMTAFGECLPYEENRVTLSTEHKDKWGIPQMIMDADFKENEMKMREDMANDAAEMLERAGAKDIQTRNDVPVMAECIHEMGTARMGNDAKTSVLNKFNQMHAVKNVFVTDGACMTSSACQNPSITYMALTARAANYAVEELKKGNI
ncbi:MAG: GMC family oxidoreductase [Cyclobacteriaceae bacterium]